jgi:flagellar protein FlbT
MTLRFDLGPFEELHIGKCVIKNSHERSLFVVEGEMPILKGKDVLSESSLSGSLEKLYYCVQRMYLEEAHEKYQGSYLQLAAQVMKENPMLHSDLHAADQLIQNSDFYKALRGLKKLIRTEAFAVDRRPSEKYIPRVNGWKQAR